MVLNYSTPTSGITQCNRVLVTLSNPLLPNVFTFSATRIPTQPTPQMQHIRNQDTYTYHKWFTSLKSPCAAEAMNNNAPMGGGPMPAPYSMPVVT